MSNYNYDLELCFYGGADESVGIWASEGTIKLKTNVVIDDDFINDLREVLAGFLDIKKKEIVTRKVWDEQIEAEEDF